MPRKLSILAVFSSLTLIATACGAQPTPAFVVSSTAVPGYGGQEATAAIPATGATATLMSPATQPASSSGAYGSVSTATQPVPATGGSPAAQVTGTPGTAGTGPALLTITQSIQYGAILADGSGMSLYAFSKDTPDTPTCTADCASTWPPFLANSGTPGVGTGVDPSMLGTTVRPDGGTQVTFNGRPLYYFSGDAKPGDINGQGQSGAWFLVAPDGELVK